MTNAQAAALWGRVTDILLGHVVDDFGVMHNFTCITTPNTDFWFDGYTDPDFYDYMRSKQ